MFEELKKLCSSRYVKRAAISKRGNNAVIENIHGAVFVVSQVNRFKSINFEVATPIHPNLSTGSLISQTVGDPYWNPVSILEVMKIIESRVPGGIPSWFSDSDRKSVVFETFESAVGRHDNILEYQEV